MNNQNVLMAEIQAHSINERRGCPRITMFYTDLFCDLLDSKKMVKELLYFVPLEPIEYPNPGKKYVSSSLFSLWSWEEEPNDQLSASIRSIHYFRKRVFEKPLFVKTLLDFGFYELGTRILVQKEDRVDIETSTVHVLRDRRGKL